MNATAETENDAAWATLNTPLPVEALMAFCRDTERLFRINPMLEFTQWQSLGDHKYKFKGRNISQEQPFDFDYELTVHEKPSGIEIEYDSGIKSRTVIDVLPSAHGSQLKITDYYDKLDPQVREAHLQEVDKSLVPWAKYLQQFLIVWHRWSRFSLWRWYMKRIWQPMKPMGRRITYILLWITVVELALIALGTAIYFVEFT